MEIKFDNQLQTHIADLIWEAESENQVSEILAIYGKDAQVVLDMILAETFDQVLDTDMAMEQLNKILKV